MNKYVILQSNLSNSFEKCLSTKYSELSFQTDFNLKAVVFYNLYLIFQMKRSNMVINNYDDFKTTYIKFYFSFIKQRMNYLSINQ